MQNLTIHRLKTDEWRRLRSIRLQALAESPDAFGSVLADEEAFEDDKWVARLARPDAATFIASTSEHDIGLATGGTYDQVAGLYSMWVAPSARGQQVGAKLIDSVVDWAKGQKHSKILLDVSDHNTSAIALYHRKGFVPTGVTGSLPPPRTHLKEHQLCRAI